MQALFWGRIQKESKDIEKGTFQLKSQLYLGRKATFLGRKDDFAAEKVPFYRDNKRSIRIRSLAYHETVPLTATDS